MVKRLLERVYVEQEHSDSHNHAITVSQLNLLVHKIDQGQIHLKYFCLLADNEKDIYIF